MLYEAPENEDAANCCQMRVKISHIASLLDVHAG